MLPLMINHEPIALCEIYDEVSQIKQSSEKVRKGTYARLNEVTKECNQLKERLEILERYICHAN